MARRPRRIPDARRAGVILLTLFGHAMSAFGFPMPASGAAEIAYPCQDHACGCLTSDLCWRGDCCCFTLEQKLAWAEANGVEPPPHVRPMVAARAKIAPKRSCCSEAATHCESKPPARVQWVVGVAAQKCRGDAESGPIRSDPAIFADASVVVFAVPELLGRIAPFSDRPRALALRPPTPPPRHS